MIWIIFGAMAVATFLSVGRILRDANPEGSRTPLRFMSFAFWMVGLLLTLSGKLLIGLCVMAVGAFALGAVAGGAGSQRRRPTGARPQQQQRSAFGERYGDGRASRRRPDFERHANAGSARYVRPRPGVMTEEEAYQILGLEPGASPEEVVRAHRTLMKKVHPDQGGSTEVAARVNAAKDVLAARDHG